MRQVIAAGNLLEPPSTLPSPQFSPGHSAIQLLTLKNNSTIFESHIHHSPIPIYSSIYSLLNLVSVMQVSHILPDYQFLISSFGKYHYPSSIRDFLCVSSSFLNNLFVFLNETGLMNTSNHLLLRKKTLFLKRPSPSRW